MWRRHRRRETLITLITTHALKSTAQKEQKEAQSKEVKLHKPGSTQGPKRKNLYTVQKEKRKMETLSGPQKQTEEKSVVTTPKEPKRRNLAKKNQTQEGTCRECQTG